MIIIITDELELVTNVRVEWDDGMRSSHGDEHHHDDDYWMARHYRYSSCLGLRDYLMFFLLIGIAIGVGYMCSYANRKVSEVHENSDNLSSATRSIPKPKESVHLSALCLFRH